MRAHLDSASQFACNMAEEPVFRNTEAGVLVEGLDEKLGVPKRYRAMREGCTANAASKLALNATEFVLKVLRSNQNQR